MIAMPITIAIACTVTNAIPLATTTMHLCVMCNAAFCGLFMFHLKRERLDSARAK